MLSGGIPSSLGNARDLEVVLLDRNRFSGEIPSTFTTLPNLTQLDVSYNNLSGYIPPLAHSIDCNLFKGNTFLQPCPTQDSIPPAGLPLPLDVNGLGGGKGRFKSVVIASVVSASAVVLVLLVLVLLLICRRRRLVRVATIRRKAVVTFTTEVPAELSYENVVRATGNFSVRNLIGMGGFGATYKAELSPGFLVAVKRLSMGRFQGLQQFDAEIRTLGRIRHKNLVTLVGYHTGDASDTFLIYNYLSGGNLEMFIKSGKNAQWPVVHKIALNVAQALAYLHYSCEPRIVHRDIKPSNILLDDDLNAYLSDFGLARLLEVSETHATTDVAGTFGYVAPEYATTCRVSDKADVYSFGVVLLELMSGKRSLDPSFSEYGNGFNIVSWAKLLIKEGRQSEAFPPPLWAGGPEDRLVGMLRLASACTMESVTVGRR
ncbi:LRR receptor-like serine/threonine-protein kinase RPK2 [Acorus calamus]|uniref:non-specific serine/threonine protein kinase n=1 Tax=Acorus calamus TaxID=4465 RepID=A0AAV9BYH7_ACOCL|nr:LRR receptor-like serine/threonine-protein kinase RPK2 [Acorus calamus]